LLPQERTNESAPDRRPAGFGGWFALYSLNSEDIASRKLVWTIDHFQVAPMALVYKGGHAANGDLGKDFRD
jgi:hypothetical protein